MAKGKIRPKGTFCLRVWASFCGWLCAKRKNFIKDKEGKYHTAFLEKISKNWTAYASQITNQLLANTKISRLRGTELVNTITEIDEALELLGNRPIQARRLLSRRSDALLELQKSYSDLKLKKLHVYELLLKAGTKYQSNAMAYLTSFNKIEPGVSVNQAEFTKHIDENDALQIYENFVNEFDVAIQNYAITDPKKEAKDEKK